MCWGVDCGDGWFKIIDNLCAAIQERVDDPPWVQEDSAVVVALKTLYTKIIWNRGIYPVGTFLLTRNNNKFSGWRWNTWNWISRNCQLLTRYEEPLEDPLRQVIAIQVKEKYGGLRFYYRCSRDPYIDGLVRMAERVAYYTCETCGATDDTVSRNGRGWIATLCKNCREDSKKLLR